MAWQDQVEPLRLIQISDLHLSDDPSEGMGWCDDCRVLNTDTSLATVLDDIQINESCFDAMIVTGDIAQNGELAAYERFVDLLAGEGVPVFCLPGNHDRLANMLRTLTGRVVTMPRYEISHGWLMLFLDSSCVGVDWGEISPSQLHWMELLIQAHSQYHIAVFIHHHPAPTGSPWLDEIALRNATAFMETLQQYPQVKICVCGHIHQELDTKVGSIRVLGTPSTCLQFQPRTSTLQFSVAPPAYRRLALNADGSVETEVIYSNCSALRKIARRCNNSAQIIGFASCKFHKSVIHLIHILHRLSLSFRPKQSSTQLNEEKAHVALSQCIHFRCSSWF